MTAELAIKNDIRLLVVTVNYKTSHLVIESLRALASEVETVPGIQVAIVDNASGDGSVEKIQAAISTAGWGNWATLMPSPVNGGFAYGNNYAVRPALQSANPPDYFVLLNPDAQIRPGAIRELLNFMEQHPDVGIAGSSFEEAEDKPWPYAFRFPSFISEFESGLRLGVVTKLLSRWKVPQTMDPDREQPIDWISGACMFIRREVFEAIGLMDEGYFLYYEETDFCLQAKRAGWNCWYVPQSRILHILGQSTGVTATDQRTKRLPQYWFDSRRRYFLKNHGWLYAALADLSWLVGFSLWRARRVLQRKPDGDPVQLLGDSFRNSVFLKREIPRQQLPDLQNG